MKTKQQIKDGRSQRKRNSKSVTGLLIHCMEQNLKYTNPVSVKTEYVSDCCGSLPKSNGDCDSSDFGICSGCGEHCDYVEMEID